MHAQDYVDYMLLSGAAKESDFAFWDGKTDPYWAFFIAWNITDF